MAQKVWFQPAKGLWILHWFRWFIQTVRWWSMLTLHMLAHLGNINQTSTRRFVPLPVACMRLAGFVGGSTGANSDACGPLECPLDRTSWCDHLANIPLSPTGGCLTIEFCGGNPTATLCYSMIPKLETRAAHVLFERHPANFDKSKSIRFDFSKLKLQPFRLRN